MKIFGHTSGKTVLRYVRYGKDKKGRRIIVMPPAKPRHVKADKLRPFRDRHPIIRWLDGGQAYRRELCAQDYWAKP